MRRFFLPFLLVVHATTCASSSPRATTPAVACADVCAHMRVLACPGARPTAAGASCETVCTNFQQGPAPWDLRCRSIAESCEAMDRCEWR